MARFGKQLDHLAARFVVTPLRDIELPLSGPACASVTFDDGRLDNYEIAREELEPRSLKGTFFLVPSLLGGSLKTSGGETPLMSIRQAKELADLGHEIGAHTMSHATLTTAPRDTARREIGESKRALEDIVGREVSSFAYPHGASDERVREIVAEEGFVRAVSTRQAVVTNDDDPFALPRITIGPFDGMLEFRAKLTPGIGPYERLRGRSMP